MSPISIPGKVTLKQSNTGVPDLDAQQYIAAVEAADGQALEDGVSLAIHRFVAGCKSDGIWDGIKASCILAGARTLSGALVPLVGTAPTNYNFVAGDYNRETGLVGDGSTKYLNSNRNNNADPQNDKHVSCYIDSLSSIDASIYICAGAGGITGQTGITDFGSTTIFRVNNAATSALPSSAVGFIGCSRDISSSFDYRNNGITLTENKSSETPINENLGILGRTTDANHSNARLSFYSIGESLDLALLDARVTTLMSDIGAAIP